MSREKRKVCIICWSYNFRSFAHLYNFFPFLGGLAVKPVEKTASKREQMAEMARRAMEKRKGVATGESIAKRVKMLSAGKAPILKTDVSPGAVVSSAAIDTTPVDLDLPEGASLESEDLAHLTPRSSIQIPGSSLRADKGKSHVVGSRSTSVSFSIPSNFMIDNTVDKSKIFPHLGKYLLPSQQVRFKDASIEDIDASAAGLSFLVSSLSYDIFSVSCFSKSSFAGFSILFGSSL